MARRDPESSSTCPTGYAGQIDGDGRIFLIPSGGPWRRRKRATFASNNCAIWPKATVAETGSNCASQLSKDFVGQVGMAAVTRTTASFVVAQCRQSCCVSRGHSRQLAVGH